MHRYSLERSTRSTKRSSLIRSWSPAIDKEQPFEQPYVVKYRRDDKELIFIAISHEHSLSSPSFETMRKIFARDKFNLVISEGFPTSMGIEPQEQLASALSDGKNGVFEGEESSYSIILAHKYKIPFVGGEPDRGLIRNSIGSRGFSKQDLFYLYFTEMLWQWKRGTNINKSELASRFAEFAKPRVDLYELPKTIDLSYFYKWYKENQGAQFSLDKIDSMTAAPIAEGTYVQRISSAVDTIRNEHLLALVKNSIAKYKQVAIVYGGSHWPMLRLALDSLMGQPSFEKVAPR